MSAGKNKKRLKSRHVKRKKNIKKSRPQNSNDTSLSKREVSINWLNFSKKNGLKINWPQKTENELENDRSSSRSKKKPVVTKVLALDCEMVSDLNNEDMLARVSVVNYNLECIYDKFVKPTSKVGDFRTRFSGIREGDLANGEDFGTVQNEVKTLLYNKILVGHALGNDFKVLKFGHHKQLIRDSSKYEPFREVSDYKSPSLKKLAKVFLDENIQEGEHSSIEDARTAMKLYKKFKKEWEIFCLKSKKNDTYPKEINIINNV